MDTSVQGGRSSVVASLMCESWNRLLEWLGEVVILCAGDCQIWLATQGKGPLS